jgi:hypothetical protein
LQKFTKRKKKRERKRQKVKGVVYKEGGKFGEHEKNTQSEVVNSLNGAR